MSVQSTMTGEIRQNLVTDRWVIYAPERAGRPHRMRAKHPAAHLPERDPECPFCLGNERMLPSIIFEIPSKEEGLWQTRVVPDKYPLLTAEADVAGVNRGIYLVTSNYGRQEVIIESRFHNCDIPMMTHEEVEAVVETYATRHSELFNTDESIESVIIFRSHGEQAGATILHPHSQVVATSIVPEFVSRREHIAENYFQQNRRCVLCDIVDFEESDRARVVYENSSFLSFVPFAAEVPFEVWITPKRHSPDFGLVTTQEKEHFAIALQEALQGFHDVLSDPDYNYVIHSYSRQNSIVPYLHWYLQIRPRLTTPSGFEIGSGMPINSSWPEEDAKVLRQEEQ
jgi:UDPglucose--hexose-1-phosphate uridylyltransferase